MPKYQSADKLLEKQQRVLDRQVALTAKLLDLTKTCMELHEECSKNTSAALELQEDIHTRDKRRAKERAAREARHGGQKKEHHGKSNAMEGALDPCIITRPRGTTPPSTPPLTTTTSSSSVCNNSGDNKGKEKSKGGKGGKGKGKYGGGSWGTEADWRSRAW